jgi:hypothetical protein
MSSLLDQMVVADFMTDGTFARHLKRMRRLYADRLSCSGVGPSRTVRQQPCARRTERRKKNLAQQARVLGERGHRPAVAASDILGHID